MDLLQAVTLGIIQGLGEFLPISSSAHLIIAPWAFGWEDPGLAFDVALHFGTLLAVLAYFTGDWIDICASGLGAEKLLNRKSRYPKHFLWLLVAATVPGAVIGYFLEHLAETSLRNPLLIAGTLTVMGAVLYWADKRLGRGRGLMSISWFDGILIGLAQAVAIIPGVSRSGSTITTALFLGVDRVGAARFSFLLSTPIIMGATVLKFKKFIHHGVHAPEIAGIAAAAVTGFLAISVLIRYVSKVSYKVFFWYRVAFSICIVAIWFLKK